MEVKYRSWRRKMNKTKKYGKIKRKIHFCLAGANRSDGSSVVRRK